MLARRADDLGFESIWIGEHLIRPDAPTGAYPYGAGDHISRYPILDPFHLVSIGGVATSRVTLGIGVLVLPLWDPVLFLRSLRTSALTCRGRFALGVGVGWWEQEFAVLGQDFSSRGRRCDQMLRAASNALSLGQVSAGDGAPIGRLFDTGIGEPATPPVELVIGGDSRAAQRRAAEFGGGWYAHDAPPDALRAAHLRIRAAVRPAPAGFTPGRWTVRVDEESTAEHIARLLGAGVERVVVSIGEKGVRRSVGELADHMQLLTQKCLAAERTIGAAE
jgi:alkanesulfonate monooxygenase SsuD/methylene tetrahydromethanopterin reductase-like flavin-dependent oxidoreductase (luciferase family)